MKKALFLITCATIQTIVMGQNYTSPFAPLNIIPETIYDVILGEASGEQAYYHVLELAPYEKDRTAEDYLGDLHETRYVAAKLKALGLPATVERLGKTKTWDGVSATLWETTPKKRKIADYRDLTAILAQGSASADVESELVWVGRGTPNELAATNVKGKIIVTEAAGARVQADAEKAGAVGIISFYAPRPLVDPIQIPNASIRPNNSLFCFNLPPREGYVLKDRLVAGEAITVHAKVETKEVETDAQITTTLIEGTDPDAGEILLSAHLFEGYVKLGANDNTSGSAVILEVARTLNDLIHSGNIPRPRRTIRFLWIPEISGSGLWVNEHKDIVAKTLCDLNLDMVGLWLSKSESYLCLHRTTMGNPHYVNDVTESVFHYVGATNKGFTATGAGRPEPLKPVFSLTGSHDPFYYSVGAHQGSSDHEVFNDFGVQIPAIMMVTWPDNYYHTSGDRPSILDPTQLRRSIVIAAVSAYAIAAADEEGALKITAEITSNAVKRLAFIQQINAKRINETLADSLSAAYKRAIFDIDAYFSNEKATLLSVLELAPESNLLKKFVDAQIDNILKTSKLNVKNLEDLAKTRGELLHATIKPLSLTPDEQKAAKIFPKATALARESGYGALRTIPRETQIKHGFIPTGFPGGGAPPLNPQDRPAGKQIRYGAEIARLTIGGNNSILDIKKSIDAQFPNPDSLNDITAYLELLKEVKLVTY
jgi:hypothetical protein